MYQKTNKNWNHFWFTLHWWVKKNKRLEITTITVWQRLQFYFSELKDQGSRSFIQKANAVYHAEFSTKLNGNNGCHSSQKSRTGAIFCHWAHDLALKWLQEGKAFNLYICRGSQNPYIHASQSSQSCLKCQPHLSRAKRIKIPIWKLRITSEDWKTVHGTADKFTKSIGKCISPV